MTALNSHPSSFLFLVTLVVILPFFYHASMGDRKIQMDMKHKGPNPTPSPYVRESFLAHTRVFGLYARDMGIKFVQHLNTWSAFMKMQECAPVCKPGKTLILCRKCRNNKQQAVRFLLPEREDTHQSIKAMILQ